MTNSSYKTNSPRYLREFLDYMSTIKARSDNTVFSYYEDIKLFLRFLMTKGGDISGKPFEEIDIADCPEALVRDVTLYDAMEFLHFMNTERSNNPRSRARRAIAIRQFYKYLTDQRQWFELSPIAKLQLPTPKKSLPKHLTLEQAQTLLKTEHSGKDTDYFGVRDYCMMTLFLNCGMRLSELVSINVNDCRTTKDPRTGEMISYLTIRGKGDKERVVYLNDACVAALGDYQQKRGAFAEENPRLKFEKAMFVSKQFKRISNRRVQQIVEDALSASGLADMGFSVHKLRHTAATLMYQNGVDVRVLQEVLGHENLDTTRIYTHVSNNQMRQAMKMNPLSQEAKAENKTGRNGEATDESER
jgi:site-specific recombinase XerD